MTANVGAPLIYGHSSVVAASGCETNLEVFAVGSHTPLLSVVLAQSNHRSSSDLAVAICVDVTLEDACIQQCEQLVDQVEQCWSASHGDADFKPSVVIFACKGDLLQVSDARWDVISASLRLLALKCGAAFAVHSSPSGSATSRQILLASMQLASWPTPSTERISFFVPPNHDSAANLLAVLEVLGNAALSVSSGVSKPLDDATPKAAPVAPDDDQEFVMAQLPAVNVDNIEMRKKFSAMVSAAILSDSSATLGGSSGIASLPSSKGVPSTKARADANDAEAFFSNLDSFLGNKRT